ncbi:MAG: molybdopterin-dependent oxidoreductase [Deltaproteobacteria bacterium]|nr:MAG: molybdopterin-dependent oxidoreductase [Deltaproteobacteria bacterium]
MKVKLIVNDKWIERQVDQDLTLLRFLREDLHLTGAKEACGKGHCGACTVIVNGKAVRSCLQRVSKLDGKRIETIEGLSVNGGLHPIQEAFISAGAVQCGFCTPGMIMATKALLDKHPSPSDAEIKEGLKHNLCRCTGYVKVIDAVKMASTLIRSQQNHRTRVSSESPADISVGASLPDIDGSLKVKGQLKFAGDIFMEDMGYGSILWSKYPHAEILSIDTLQAEKVKGVRAVLTAKDIPGRNSFGILKPDQPVLADNKVRFLGDPVALVIADSEEIARRSRDLISVEYKALKGVFSIEEALSPESPPIHEGGNIMRQIQHLVGDIEKAFAEADLIVEREYSTPFIDHAYLETESGVAALAENGKINVWTCTQMPFEFRVQIADILGLAEEKVRIITTPLGGAFGGKVPITIQALLALGALVTRRPVKIVLTREESLCSSTKRHASLLNYRTGFTKAGKIIANHAKILLDTGPYADVGLTVLDQASIFSCGPYDIPNVKIDALALFTNNANGGAMRGFGINQVAIAMEQQLDIAAEKLKVDPFELRLMNALEIGKSIVSGEILRASVPIKETIRTAQKAMSALPPLQSQKKVGVGVASGFKNVGIGKGHTDNAGAIIELTENGMIRSYVSTVDMGQGNRTVLMQMIAHELGIKQDKVEIIIGDTDLVLRAVGVAGERATYCSGNAVIMAAKEFRKRLIEKISQHLDIPRKNLAFDEAGIIHENKGVKSILTLEDIARILASKGEKIRVEHNYIAPKTFPISFGGIPEAGTAMARYAPSKTRISKEEYRNYLSYAYITSVAVVEVDESTGVVTVKKVISAVDVGKAINPQNIEGQIEGSIMMGIGYALSENYELSRGIPLTDSLKKCGIPTINQTPDITTLIIEEEDPGGPYGAKGISEVATVPVTPAVLNAINDAVGVRIYDLPATKNRILSKLSGGRRP